MEVLRPAVLGSSDSLGVQWLGAWSHSVRPGSRPEASHEFAMGLPLRWLRKRVGSPRGIVLTLPLVGIEVVAVEARVAGMLMPVVLMLAPGKAMMPMGITSLRGMDPLRCQQHLGGTLWQPLAQGQLRW